MIHARYPRIATLVILSALFAAAAQWTQAEDTLSGRDLLRVMRDKEGRGEIPSYENRLRETGTLKKPAGAEPPTVPEESPGLQEPNTSQEPLAPAVSDISTKAATQPPGDQLLQMIPAESMFCVRVNNFDFTLSQIDQFLAGVSPMPMAVSIFVRTQLAGMLGSPELNGVKMGGNFAIFGPLVNTDLTDPDNIGILVPVTDYRQFVGGNPNVGEPDERGVSRIISQGIPPMLVTEVEGYALISPQGNNNELIATAKSISISSASMSSLENALGQAEAKRAADESIWAYGNVQQASKTFGPLLSGWIEQARQATQAMEANQQAVIAQLEEAINALDPSDPAQKAKIDQLQQRLQMLKTTKADAQTAETLSMVMDLYAAMLETLMHETKHVSLMVTPKPDVLQMTIGVSAMPGTGMADLFTTDVSVGEQNKFLAYLEDGAVMNFATSKFLGKLNSKSMELFVPKLSETLGVDKEKMMSLASDVATVFSGSDAMSFYLDPASKPPFVGKYVIEVSDEAKLNKVIQEGIELFNTGGIAKFYEGLGMKTSITLNRGVGEYKGVSIDAAEFAFQSTDANSPQGQMIAAMYGSGIKYRWGAVDGLWVCTFGGNADPALRKLIDQVKAGGPKELASETKAALALLPDAGKADFMGTFNILRYFKMVAGMMGAMMPVPLPQMDLPTKSNVVMASQLGSGAMTTKIALPKEHVGEIMTAVQMMMQQKMQIQQGEMIGP